MTEHKKPTVLVFIGTYLPGYRGGGPVRSIANLTESLGSEIDFRIVTADRDIGENTAYPGIQADVWTDAGRAKVLYLKPESMGFRTIYRLLKTERADYLYLNSFFARPFSILPMIARTLGARGQRQVILAPRGEFAPGALRLGYFRKQAWIFISRFLGVYRSALFQASSVFEESDIRDVLGLKVEIRSVRVVVASDIPSSDFEVFPRSFVNGCAKEPGHLRIVFLSRIAPMKNLRGAIRILRGMSGSIEFNIYGPREDPAYWSGCEDELRHLPPNIQVGIHAEVEHSRVREVLASHHALLLPTLGENFGHVIYEALCAGVPVLISDRTSWRDLESHGAGWDIPLEREDLFRAAMERLLAMDSGEFHTASESARTFAQEFTADTSIITANRALFFPEFTEPGVALQISEGGSTPGLVD